MVGVRRAICTGLAAAVIVAGQAGAASRAHPVIEGPFGRGTGEVWLLRPDGPPRNVVVFVHGWYGHHPSAVDLWPVQFRPWLDHLVAGGSAVIFPRYQRGGDESAGTARVASFRSGLEEGFARLGEQGLPVVAAGYSFGGSLVFYYAANAERWGLPVPRAVMSIFPAGPIRRSPLPALSDSVDVLILVGDRDKTAGPWGANAFWAWLRDHPDDRKLYQIVHSGPALTAVHLAPKYDSPGAQRAFWLPLDHLVVAAT